MKLTFIKFYALKKSQRDDFELLQPLNRFTENLKMQISSLCYEVNPFHLYKCKVNITAFLPLQTNVPFHFRFLLSFMIALFNLNGFNLFLHNKSKK